MFEDLRNNFDFFIRNKIRFSRKNFVEKNLKSIERNDAENKYVKNILEDSFEKRSSASVKVLDIGCKNWFYARGEYDFFKSFCNEVLLDGVEIDPYRLYTNLYNRYEVAKYYTRGIPANYIVGNLLEIEDKYDYIVWFLPFVLERPHKKWGLPMSFFCPEKMLAHAYDLLLPQGQMLIINQGVYETSEQKALLGQLGIKYCELGLMENKHFAYKNERYGFLVCKD